MACFRKVHPPSYGEFLLCKVITKRLVLDVNKTHTKEYLESVISY